MAIIVWKNSLVFHSLDKLTSFYLHTFPAITVTLLRWDMNTTSLTFTELLTLPFGLFTTWQLGYWTITEILLRERLEEDKELMTSLRWLATDQKNKVRNVCLSVLVKLRVGRPGEELEIMDSLKAKIVFTVLYMVGSCSLLTHCHQTHDIFQIYTALTILPTHFLFSSYIFTWLYLVGILCWGTWNGASYYMKLVGKKSRDQDLVHSGKMEDGQGEDEQLSVL